MAEEAHVIEYAIKVVHSDNAMLYLSSTLGAGDAFIAGILYGFTCHDEDWDLSREVRFANELAGRKVVREGFFGLGKHMRHAS